MPAARLARHLIRLGRPPAIASLRPADGWPTATLGVAASDQDGAPLLLVSRLSLHGRNLEAESRLGLLVDGVRDRDDEGAAGDPRLSLCGRAIAADRAGPGRRLAARHPASAAWLGWADMRLYRIEIETARLIAGFGRVVDLAPETLLIPAAVAARFAEAEPELLQTLATTDPGLITALARAAGLCGGAGTAPVITGVDPDGCDLRAGTVAARLAFADPLTDPAAVPSGLAVLADLAGAAAAPTGRSDAGVTDSSLAAAATSPPLNAATKET